MSTDDRDLDGTGMTSEHTEPARARVWPGRLARLASGLLVAGVVAGSVVAATRVPDSSDTAAQPDRVSVPPSPSTLVCPGGPILPASSGHTDAQYDAVPVQPVTSLSALTAGSDDGSGQVAPLAGGSPVARLAAGGDAATLDAATAPLVVTAQPGRSAARLAATGSSVVTAGDLRGLIAASCVTPSADAWLVGGSTELSSTAQLVLLDAGTTPAQVTVELWGPAGRADATSEQYLVAPGASRVVALGAVAAEQRRLVVHVAASGGSVAAFMQDSSLDGFTPTGAALVTAGTPPARTQVVPGVAVVASATSDTVAPAVRLLVPGSAAATASVTLLGPAGEAPLPGATGVSLPAGEVTDIPLTGLTAGAYTVVVHADQPVLAGAVVTRPGARAAQGGGTMYDRAWAPSSVPGRSGVVAIPAGVDGSVVVSAIGSSGAGAGLGSGTGTLRVLGAHGEVLATRTVRVGAGGTGAWTLTDLLSGSDDLVAGPQPVRAADDDATATAPAAPPVDVGSAQSYFPPDDAASAPATTDPATTDPATGGATAPSGGAGTTAAVAGLDLVLPGGGDVQLAWAFVATLDRPDGALVAVLAPVPVTGEPPTVAVRRDGRAGIR